MSIGVGLFDYQNDALNRLKNGCILYGGVGSGKSRTGLAYYYIQNGGETYYCKKDSNGKYFTKGKNGEFQAIDGWYERKNPSIIHSHPFYIKMKQPCDLYIITTARKRDTLEWEEELSNFMLSSNPKNNFYYDNKVVVDSWNNIAKYVNVTNSFFLFDEQRVVGRGSWVKSFLKITKSNRWILLTATPGDKWEDYIPVFTANGFFRNRTEFSRQHLVYSRFTKYPKIERYLNEGHLLHLKKQILIDMSFTRETQRHDEYVITKYDEDTYNYICTSRWNIYKDKPIETASEYCTCLRKLVNSDISRQHAVLEILEKHPRAIIFYSFDYELDILRKILEGYPYSEWNGHKHESVPEGECWVYLVEYAAGSEAWNCITTDTIIFYSQSYSYRTMQQASGRIDRLNTPYKDLYYYHLRSNAKIDLAIRNAIRKKKKFNELGFAPVFKKDISKTEDTK